MAILKDKKVVIIGDRDGVPGPAIAECVKTAGGDVVFSSTAAGLAAETVTAGDPTFAGPLTGVQLGLTTYHVCEPELKKEFDPAVYDEQVGMMEMVLDVDDIVDEMSAIRNEYCKYL